MCTDNALFGSYLTESFYFSPKEQLNSICEFVEEQSRWVSEGYVESKAPVYPKIEELSKLGEDAKSLCARIQ